MGAYLPEAGFAEAELLVARCARLEKQLARERAARRAAEDIAEQGLRELYLGQERLKLLNRIAGFANDCTEPADALRFAVEQLRDHLGWAVGHALIVAGSGDQQRLEATAIWSQRDPLLFLRFVEASRNFTAGPSDVIPGRLLIEPHPQWVAKIAHEAGFSRANAARHCQLSGALAVPILAGAELAAVLEFYQTDSNPPAEGLVEMLAQVGRQIGRVFTRRKFADALQRNSTTDPVTNLPNRAALERLNLKLFPPGRAAANPRLAMVCAGLDGLQLINDTLGHAAGDALLAAIAQRLRTVVTRFADSEQPRTLMLIRLGGNLFGLVLVCRKAANDAEAAANTAAAAHALASAIHRQLAEPLHVAGQTVHVQAAIGIALDSAGYHDLDALLRDADVAMVQARSEGAGLTAMFEDAMRERMLQRFELESELRAAIDAGQFELHYQPIVQMSDRRVLGFEALVRWRRTPEQLVMPDHFIGLAETTGLIIPLGTWVLREACRAAVRLRSRAGPHGAVYVAVNVAAQQFQQPGFVKVVRDILLETGADPALIRLELTETSAMANPDHAREAVNRLKAMGIKVSLDDFGTGYSSLAYLQAIPFDTIKVDSVFVRHQAQTNADWSIVTAVKALADAMGMTVIVEGVENEFQMDMLKEIGCAVGQGYLFNRPLSEGEAARRAGLA